MGVYTIGGGDVGGGPGGVRYVCNTPPKHYSSIYRYSSDIGAVTGGGAATGSADGHEMVGSGRVGLRGSAGEGEGSGGVGADRKVGRWRRDEGLRRRG